LFKQALGGQAGWQRQWRSPEPKAEYDVIIVGAGGHGLATAHYLAKEHGITNVAVVEKGWLSGGNTGRNTTIIRSNYLFDESAALYEHALKLWEGLSQDINCNVMYSPRGVLMLAHNIHDVQSFKRHVHANRLNGIDNEWLSAEECKEFCPPLNVGGAMRYTILGGALQRRGGTARHDAVAWGYFLDARNTDDPDFLAEVASSYGFGPGEVGSILGNHAERARTEAESVRSRAQGVSSVPTFIIGGVSISGARSEEEIGFMPRHPCVEVTEPLRLAAIGRILKPDKKDRHERYRQQGTRSHASAGVRRVDEDLPGARFPASYRIWQTSGTDQCRSRKCMDPPGQPFTCDQQAMDREIIPGMQRLLKACRANGHPVIHVTTAYEITDRNAPFTDMGLWHCKIPIDDVDLKNKDLWAIDSRIAAASEEHTLLKKRASAFHGTGLAGTLRAAGIDTILVTGVTATACVRTTICDGLADGFRTIAVRECIGDRVPGAVAWNLYDIDAEFADVQSVDECVDYLNTVKLVRIAAE
jgi:nicotinamidase-related amidase